MKMDKQVIVLSPKNKEDLLWRVSSTMLHKVVVAASAIQERLEHLCPDLKDKFCPKGDTVSRFVLRMFCSPPPTAGVVITSFIAISYCWHSPDWKVSNVAGRVRGGWPISPAMVDAIMALRQSPAEGVWLDQLCINQADDVKKEHAVGAMDILYRSARRLIILLEDIQLTEMEEAAALTYAGFYEDLCRKANEPGLQASAKAILARTYIGSRESLLAQDARDRNTAAANSFALRTLSARWFSRAW